MTYTVLKRRKATKTKPYSNHLNVIYTYLSSDTSSRIIFNGHDLSQWMDEWKDACMHHKTKFEKSNTSVLL